MTAVPLPVIVEVAFGADPSGDPADWVWTDLSVEARRVPPSISRGRSDEASNVSPADATVVLDNKDSRFTPHNPESPFWPNVRRGTPLRISVEVDAVKHVRFVGHIASWEPIWPLPTPKEGDVVGVAHVRVNAGGLLRRLVRDSVPLQSPLFRRVTSVTDPRILAYWPLEDGNQAEQGQSPLSGVEPMGFGGEFNFGSNPDPQLAGGGSVVHVPGEKSAGWLGQVPPAAVPRWRVEWWGLLPEAPASGFFTLMIVYSAQGSTAKWVADVSSSTLRLRGFSSSGSLQWTHTQSATGFSGVFGHWVRFSLTVNQVGTSAERNWSWSVVGESTVVQQSGSFGSRAGRPASVANLFTTAPPEGYSFGHIVVSTGIGGVAIFGSWSRPADEGHLGEPAAERVERLCNEENVPVQIVGTADESEPMGIQRTQTLFSLLDECADAGGVLSEVVDELAIGFRTRDTLWNQSPAVVADVAQRGLAQPFDPVLDDRGLANDVTAAIPDRSEAHVVDQAHVDAEGRYDIGVDRNVETQRRLLQHAGWLLANGTLPAMRYPDLSVNVRASGQVDDWVALTTGDRVQAINLPRQHPADVDVLVEGWTETLTGFEWRIEANCSPAQLYTVGVLDDGEDPPPDLNLDRLDTDGSELVTAKDDTETGTWDVEVTAGPLWTTDADYFPLDIALGGERVTVSGISGGGAGIDAVHGMGDADADTASTSHVAPSVDADGAADLLICAWQSWSETGTYTVPGSMTADADTTGFWGTMQTATETLGSSGATGTRTGTFSIADTWGAVAVIAHRSVSGSPVIEEALSDVETGQPVADITLTTDPSTEEGWWLLAIHGWVQDTGGIMGPPSGDGWEPVGDSATLDFAPRIRAWARRVTEAGAQAVTFFGSGDNTDDDDQHARLYVLSGVTSAIQTFTVTDRSVNDVTKPHAAGTAVNPADPFRLTL